MKKRLFRDEPNIGDRGHYVFFDDAESQYQNSDSTINIPNKTSTNIIGNNQYFLLVIKKSQNSFKNHISKLFSHCIISFIAFYPV